MTRTAQQQVVDLTRELVRLDTVNPPGSEHEAGTRVASRLESAGFLVELHVFAEGRVNVVARSPRSGSAATQCWTGHLDTVPLGGSSWTVDAFAGQIDGGRIYGRGASDMKGGVAAMVVALEQVTASAGLPPGLSLVFTSGEETGCEGAIALAADGDRLPAAEVLLVGEPTANRAVLGHKGVMWLELVASGRAAHASRPEEGANAIEVLVDALVRLRSFDAGGQNDLLGTPTRSVGTIAGGVGVNIVPDHASARVDLRTLPGTDHDELLGSLRDHLGRGVEVGRLTALPAIRTERDDPRIAAVLDSVARVTDDVGPHGGVTYFTDASVLAPALDDCAVVVCGPGEPGQAHVTDEWCEVAKLEQAVEIYATLAASGR